MSIQSPEGIHNTTWGTVKQSITYKTLPWMPSNININVETSRNKDEVFYDIVWIVKC